MPIYEYSCQKCNEIFAVYQSTTVDAKDTKCPKCGSGDVKKRMSSFSCCSPGGGASSFSTSGSGGGFGGG